MKSALSILFLFALVNLTGCASSQPETHYYLLSQGLGEFKKAKPETPTLFLEKITLASHLNQQALVLTHSKHKVKPANYHFWAQPLDQGIGQVLEYEMNQQCACHIRAERRHDSSVNTDLSVTVFIEQIIMNHRGGIELSGVFKFTGKEEKQQRFHLTETLSESGYEAGVAKLQELIKRLAQNIIQKTEIFNS